MVEFGQEAQKIKSARKNNRLAKCQTKASKALDQLPWAVGPGRIGGRVTDGERGCDLASHLHMLRRTV